MNDLLKKIEELEARVKYLEKEKEDITESKNEAYEAIRMCLPMMTRHLRNISERPI